MNKDIWIYAEQQNGKIMNVALELLGEGRRLSEEVQGECNVCAVLIGNKIDNLVDELYHYGADVVYTIDDESLEHYNGGAYLKVFADAVKEYDPDIVLIGATYMGNELASRIASRVDTGLATNCIRLDISNDSYVDYLEKSAAIDVADIDIDNARGYLKQTRPGDDGLMTTIVTTDTRPQIATVNPGVMDKIEEDSSRKGTAVEINPQFTDKDLKVKLVEATPAVTSTIPLTEADIVCACGRGIGEPEEGLKLMEEFTEKVGGALGASRFVVDSGWLTLPHQVGQSGKTVKPKIYFACGISGALQHMVGMQDSDTIVAINKNPDAPMMEIADFAIVADLYKIIPAIIEVWDDFK